MADITTLELGELQTNCYLIPTPGDSSCIIIDPGDEPERIIDVLKKEKRQPLAILLTHGHYDHIGGVARLKREYSIPVWLHTKEIAIYTSPMNHELMSAWGIPLPPLPDRLIEGDENVEIGGVSLKFIHTPGHTPGSVTIQIGERLFTGDTLFQGSVGRTDLPGGNFRQLQNSLRRLMEFTDSTLIFPGHGDSSTIGEERETNPYL